MQNAIETGGGGKKAALKDRAIDELKAFAVITLYLWVLFVLFATYKRLLMHENGISAWNQGFAIVNALIFAKVILIAQAFSLGEGRKDRSLLSIALGKSLLFTIVLILFHIAEEAVRAWFKDLPLSTALTDFGGGFWFGLVTYAAIFFVALIPFFTVQEIAKVIGADALWALLFTRGRKAFRLIQE